MDRLLLINLETPHHSTMKRSYIPPIGLWQIRTALEPFVDVQVVDLDIGDKIEDYNIRDYDTIGISARFSIQHNNYIDMIKYCVSKTKAYIIGGGFHASAIGMVDGVDEVVNGDGVKYFLDKRMGLGDNGFWRFAKFKKSEIERYWQKKAPHDLQSKTDRWIPLETSKGCNGSCKYCGVRRYWGRWKGYSIESITEYIEYLVGNGIEEVFIEDDNISHETTRFIELIKLFKRKKIYWSCPNGIRIRDIIRDEVVRELDGSTCWRLSLPFETGSRRTAQLMGLGKKWATKDEADGIVRKLKNIGIKTCGFFIIGFPEETIADIETTLDYANGLDLDQRNIYIATPYPGTALYETCKEKNYLTYDGQELYTRLLYTDGMISTDHWTAEEVKEIKRVDREKAINRMKM